MLKKAYLRTFLAMATIHGFGVVSGIMCARLLGRQGRGELAIVLFIPGVIASLGVLGLPQAVAFQVSKRPEAETQVAIAGFQIAVGLALLQMLAAYVALPFLLPRDKIHLLGIVRWFLPYVMAFFTGQALLAVDQGRRRFGRYAVLSALPAAVYVLGISMVWAAGLVSVAAFAACNLGAHVMVAVVRLGMVGPDAVRRLASRALVGPILKRGMRFHLPEVSGIALQRADYMVLIPLLPSEQIGLYAVGVGISMGLAAISGTFVRVGFVTVASESDPRQGGKVLARQFRLAQVILLGSGLSLALLAPWIIHLAFGRRFVEAAPTARYLVIAASLWGLARVMDNGLRALGHSRAGALGNVVALLLFVGFGVKLIPAVGLVGIGIAKLLAQAVNLGYLVAYGALRAGIPIRSLWGFSLESLQDGVRFFKFIMGALKGKPARPVGNALKDDVAQH